MQYSLDRNYPRKLPTSDISIQRLCFFTLVFILTSVRLAAQETILYASDTDRFDGFGSRVVVHEKVAFISKSRGAYAFRFDGLSWNEEQKFESPTGSSRSSFGQTVALFGDVALIGEPGESGSESRPSAEAWR